MEKYPVIGVVRALLSFGGWAAIVIAAFMIITGIEGLTHSNDPMAVAQGWMKIVSGVLMVFSGLVSVAISEAISVIVNIEINTRDLKPIFTSPRSGEPDRTRRPTSVAPDGSITSPLAASDAQRWRKQLADLPDDTSITINGVLVWKLKLPTGTTFLVNKVELSDIDEVLRSCGLGLRA